MQGLIARSLATALVAAVLVTHAPGISKPNDAYWDTTRVAAGTADSASATELVVDFQEAD